MRKEGTKNDFGKVGSFQIVMVLEYCVMGQDFIVQTMAIGMFLWI